MKYPATGCGFAVLFYIFGYEMFAGLKIIGYGRKRMENQGK